MKSIRSNKVNKLFAIGATFLVFLLLFNNTVNLHTHISEDGKLISHSHPFNKSNKPQQNSGHTHTKTELAALSDLVKFTILSIILFQIFNLFYKNSYQPLVQKLRYNSFQRTNKDRAPPAQF